MSAAAHLNALDEAAARVALTRCCGASRWVQRMVSARPFADDATLLDVAKAHWAAMAEADILEAFGHHPEIGANIEALREKFAATAQWSAGEQASVATASEDTLVALRDGNVAYRQRYGFIFIVCATAKTAEQMLALLRERMHNERAEELAIAAGEQAKITALRVAKLAD